MSFTKEEVVRIAHLARIGIHEDEVASTAQDLNGIFAWIDQLQATDVSHVNLHNGFDTPQMYERQDHTTSQCTHVLKNAPQAEHGFFVVPKVIE